MSPSFLYQIIAKYQVLNFTELLGQSGSSKNKQLIFVDPTRMIESSYWFLTFDILLFKINNISFFIILVSTTLNQVYECKSLQILATILNFHLKYITQNFYKIMLGSLRQFIQVKSQPIQLLPILHSNQSILNQFQITSQKEKNQNLMPKLKSSRIKSLGYIPSDKSFLLKKYKKPPSFLIDKTQSQMNFQKQKQRNNFKQIEKPKTRSQSLELYANQKQKLRHGHYLLRSIARIQQQEQQSAKSFLQLSLQKIFKGMMIPTSFKGFQAINQFKKTQTQNQNQINQYLSLQITPQKSKINKTKQTVCNSPSKINNKNRIRLQKCKAWAQKRQKSLKMFTNLKPVQKKPFKIDLKSRKHKLKQVKQCVQVLTEDVQTNTINITVNN